MPVSSSNLSISLRALGIKKNGAMLMSIVKRSLLMIGSKDLGLGFIKVFDLLFLQFLFKL